MSCIQSYVLTSTLRLPILRSRLSTGFSTSSKRRLNTSVVGESYWQRTPWKDVPAEEFNSYRWQLRNTITDKCKLYNFLAKALPEKLAPSKNILLENIRHRDQFIEDAVAATKVAPMAIRLTPHILSRVDWSSPLDDPIRKQFIPLASGILPDTENLKLDSLHEEEDSPVPGLVHRYPGRALFLATSICPVYCRFCTRSYAVGAGTESVTKKPQKPSRRRWETVFKYIESHPDLQDIVVSGGDAYYLQPDDLRAIGERLLSIDHIRRVRFASKGLAVAPGRIIPGEPWTETLIDLSKQGRKLGKQVCLHTHINHAREITWVTKKAANYLFEHGVIVRNQAVLLKGVNNTKEDMSELIHALSAINIQPYYVYQCDMVRGVEDLRTPLSEIIDLDKKLRGTLSGFMMPSFVIDLPGGGGKRLVSTKESYDEATGEATYRAPGLPGTKGLQPYTYNDPRPFTKRELLELRTQREKAREMSKALDDAEKQVDQQVVVDTSAAAKTEVAKHVVDMPSVMEPMVETPVVKETTVEAPKVRKPARQEKSAPLSMPTPHWDTGHWQKERADPELLIYSGMTQQPAPAQQSVNFMMSSRVGLRE